MCEMSYSCNVHTTEKGRMTPNRSGIICSICGQTVSTQSCPISRRLIADDYFNALPDHVCNPRLNSGVVLRLGWPLMKYGHRPLLHLQRGQVPFNVQDCYFSAAAESLEECRLVDSHSNHKGRDNPSPQSAADSTSVRPHGCHQLKYQKKDHIRFTKILPLKYTTNFSPNDFSIRSSCVRLFLKHLIWLNKKLCFAVIRHTDKIFIISQIYFIFFCIFTIVIFYVLPVSLSSLPSSISTSTPPSASFFLFSISSNLLPSTYSSAWENLWFSSSELNVFSILSGFYGFIGLEKIIKTVFFKRT